MIIKYYVLLVHTYNQCISPFLHTHTHMHTYIHSYTYTHVHTYIHTIYTCSLYIIREYYRYVGMAPKKNGRHTIQLQLMS